MSAQSASSSSDTEHFARAAKHRKEILRLRKIGWTKVSLSRKYGIPKPIIEKLISVLPEEKA